MTTDLAKKFQPMPPIPLELVAGSMSILRIGPVSVPLHSMVRIAMRSEMMLLLRYPRLEIQTLPGVAMRCDIVDIWVGDDRPNVPQDFSSLGVIQRGQALQAILINHMTQVVNASVVVEGDEVRVVHWAVDCDQKDRGGCAGCRWRTQCYHEECERSLEMTQSCIRAREDEHVRKIAMAQPPVKKSKPGGLWRPWDPLRG